MNKERYAMEIESNPLKDYIKDLQTKNTKLKQDKQELIEWLKEKIETKKEYMKTDISYSVFYESDIKKLQEILERLGE